MSLEKKKKLRQQRKKKSTKTIADSYRQHIRKIGLLVAVFGAAIYFNTWHHGYVLDDFSVIKENWVVQKGMEGISTIWKTPYRYGYWNGTGTLYRPLTLSMFAIEWSIAPDTPSLSHLINILLYALCGYVLFKLLHRILNKHHPAIPLIAALLFMAHPLHTEVVANIKSRDEILAFLFSMYALLLLLRSIDTGNIKYRLTSMFCFLLGMFSKEGTVSFLLLIPLVLWFFTDLRRKKILVLASFYLLPTLIYLGARTAVLGNGIAPKAISVMDNMLVGIHDTAARLATTIYLMGKHLFMLLFPYPLVCDYSIWQIPKFSFFDWQVVLTLIAYISMMFLAVKTARQKHLLAFAALWYVASMALYSNLFITIGSHFAERFQFVSSLGFCLFAAYVLTFFSDTKTDAATLVSLNVLIKQNRLAFGILIPVLLCYSYLVIHRNKEWKSDYTLYSHDVLKAPNSSRAHYYFGLELMKTKALNAPSEQLKQQYLDSAITEFSKATSIYTHYADAFDQLGLAYYRKNDYQHAVANYRLALKYNPYKAMTYSNLGAIYFNRKQFDKALEVYQKAILYNPRYADAYQNLGSTLATLGRMKEAIEAFKKGLEFEPNNPQLNKFLGITYQNTGDVQNARYYLDKAKSLGAEVP